jgi:hypothetical protein
MGSGFFSPFDLFDPLFLLDITKEEIARFLFYFEISVTFGNAIRRFNHHL